MSTDLRTKNNLHFVCRKVLTSLAKFFIKFGMTYPEFEHYARLGFVKSQLRADATNKKNEALRIHALIDLPVPEIEALLNEDIGIDGPDENDMIAPADTLAIWFTNKRFLDEQGQPVPLPYEHETKPCFVNLVEHLHSNIPPIITLKALLESGVVEERADGMLYAKRRIYVPKRSQSELIYRMGRSLMRIMNTLNHNISVGPDDPRLLESSSTSRWFPRENIAELEEVVRNSAMDTINRVDDFIQSKETRDRNYNELCEVGLGMYYFCLDRDENILTSKTKTN